MSPSRKYPISEPRRVPTTDRATWWPTSAVASAFRRSRVEVVRNDRAVASSRSRVFDTSTTTDAPTGSGRVPHRSPCRRRRRGRGTASCPWALRLVTTPDPMSPVPLMTIFMVDLRGLVAACQRPRPSSRAVASRAGERPRGITRVAQPDPGAGAGAAGMPGEPSMPAPPWLPALVGGPYDETVGSATVWAPDGSVLACAGAAPGRSAGPAARHRRDAPASSAGLSRCAARGPRRVCHLGDTWA